MSKTRIGSLDGWTLLRGEKGWVDDGWGNFPKNEPKVRNFAQGENDTTVTVWVEAGSVQIEDAESYYPGGCYSVPLSVILWLTEHPE